MDAITIEVRDTGLIIVHEKKLIGSRLRYTSPVLYVYVKGVIRPAQADMVRYHATAAVLLRGGRAFDMRRVEASTRTKQAKAPEIKPMETFPDEYSYECKMCGKDADRLDSNGHCSSCRQVWDA